MKRKKILIIITGGTITLKKFNNSVNIPDKLISKLRSSEILKNHNLDFEVNNFSSKPSPNFSLSNMFNLAIFIEKRFIENKYSGFVILHGTDTIEETSFFLDLYFSDLKVPIVLTGSMKVFLDPLYDGYNNLISSVIVASNYISRDYGVLVVFNNKVMSSLHVSKYHTNDIDSFKSINFPDVGYVMNGNVFLENYPKRFSLPQVKSINDNCFIYKTFPGDSGIFLKELGSIFEALVIEGFGDGNVPDSLVPIITSLIEKKIPVAITSRVPNGILSNFYTYVGGGDFLSKLGCLSLPELNSQKMRIFLVYLTSLSINFDDLNNIFKNKIYSI